MTQDSARLGDVVSRRKFLAATGAVSAVGLAGCSSQSTDEGGNQNGGNSGGTEQTTQQTDDSSDQVAMLTAEGSSTVYPIANKGSSYWNSNPPADDGEYWGSNSEGSVPGWDQIQTDMRLADYFAGLYGFEPTGKQATPPYMTSIGLSHSGTGCKSVVDGLVDIGNSSGPITAELGWSEQKANNTVVDHVLGRDGQPLLSQPELCSEVLTWDLGPSGVSTGWSGLVSSGDMHARSPPVQ